MNDYTKTMIECFVSEMRLGSGAFLYEEVRNLYMADVSRAVSPSSPCFLDQEEKSSSSLDLLAPRTSMTRTVRC